MAHIHSGALSASTVTTVTLDQPYESITVINRSATTDEIWFRLDGTNPTAAGDDCYLVGPGKSVTVAGDTAIAESVTGANAGSVIKLISSTTPNYTVEGS